jgi:hypothetical protein
VAKRKKSQSARPQLSRFLLLGLSAVNGYVGQGALRLVLQREQEIELVAMDPPEGQESRRIALRVKMAVVGRREGEEGEGLRVEGIYEGRFVFSPEVTMNEVEQLADDEAFQFALTSQVVPLASMHLKDQLELMGLSSSRMPIGL